MSAFDRRLAKGAELQKALIDFLDNAGVEYLLSGYERLIGSSNARKIVTRNTDSVSLFIRHYPDISVVKPDRSVLIEVKNSSGIERDCYSTYLSLKNSLDLCVLLFLKNKKLCLVQDLKFKQVSRTDPIARMEVPVTDGIWREPRLLPQDQYYAYLDAYKAQNKSTSGCSFAFIDFNRTRFYPLDAISHSLNRAV